MISKKMEKLVAGSSVTRAMFEEGKKMAAEFGAENVYDFSLGNPNVPAPAKVSEAIKEILDTEDPVVLHGYMSNVGYPDVRAAVADSLNKRFDTDFTENNIIMTVGAAGGLNTALKTLLDPGDEVIVFAPFFSEYTNYIKNFDGVQVVISPDLETFQPNLEELKAKVSPRTKAVIMNNPNNPTGVIYSEETLIELAKILNEAQAKYDTDIYLISDEPYRELVYSDVEVPYVTKYYKNTIVGYSFSKSLSLPGERIGYLVIPSQMNDYENVWAAAGVATRILGFVNAPSLMQKAVAKCLDEKTDISYYGRNRDTLYNGLTELGFECVKPDGAFYLFVKSPVERETEFVKKCKEQHILVVPATGFACPGYVRIAYCVAYETIVNSMPGFKKVAEYYQLKK